MILQQYRWDMRYMFRKTWLKMPKLALLVLHVPDDARYLLQALRRRH